MQSFIDCQLNSYWKDGYTGQIQIMESSDISTRFIFKEDEKTYADINVPDAVLDNLIKALQIYKRQKENLKKLEI